MRRGEHTVRHVVADLMETGVDWPRDVDVVRLPPREFGMRLGFVIVTGADEPACDRHFDRVFPHLSIEGTPESK